MTPRDLRRLTLHQLRVFRAVARRLNFTHAAADLGLTQSAVSAQMRELGRLVGVPLIEIHGRRVHLTDAGRAFEAHAARVEGEMRELGETLAAMRGGEAGTISIGASTTLGTYLLPKVLGEFRAAHPGVEVRLRIGNSADVERWVADNEADLGFVGSSSIGPPLEARPILDDEVVFACRPGHPLAAAGEVELERLVEEQFLVREAGSATRRVVEQRLYERDLELRRTMELGSLDAIKQGVMAGLGLSLFSLLTVDCELEHGKLARIPVRGFTL